MKDKPPKPCRQEVFLLSDDGIFPNSRLPLVIYRDAIAAGETDPAAVIEKLFARHAWSNSWRDGIYSYHHYHSMAHEVLGVAAGWARVQFGGENGILQNIFARDVVAIPAGVAHKNAGASDDFAVVGAYAGGLDWDIKRGRAGERPGADRNISRVPLPAADPVYGANGPLKDRWK